MPQLSQLIYRSRATPLFRRGDLDEFVAAMSRSNAAQGLTGVLVFDGEYFLQVVEGGRRQLEALLELLRHDARHSALVVLRLDAIKQRAFPSWSMTLVPLRHLSDSGPSGNGGGRAAHLAFSRDLTSGGDDRLRLVMDAFLNGHWRDNPGERAGDLGVRPKRPLRVTPPQVASGALQSPGGLAGFAFQPIVDTASGQVRALEALLRGPQGESPAELLAQHAGDAVYRFDLESKATAIELFAALEVDCDLTLNVLPMTLADTKDACGFLLDALQRHQIAPERLILEVTEEEAITKPQMFIAQMQALRAMGVRVAIDDFGAGFAGLSLLSVFQPDKLKIDRTLVRDIHQHGPRQAIVRAVAQICVALGIEVVAEGVEQWDELNWLEGVGITCFQGFLLSRPQLAGIGEIRWYR